MAKIRRKPRRSVEALRQDVLFSELPRWGRPKRFVRDKETGRVICCYATLQNGLTLCIQGRGVPGRVKMRCLEKDVNAVACMMLEAVFEEQVFPKCRC